MSLVNLLVHFMETYGLLAVFLGMAAESLAVPVFSEVFLAFSGYLISSGSMEFGSTLTAAVAGSMAGNLLGYAIGHYGGRQLLNRYGHHLGSERLVALEARLQRSAAQAVFLGRILSGVRSVSAYLAGTFHIPLATYVFFSLLGSLVWAGAVLVAGYLLGNEWITLMQRLHGWGTAFIVIIFGVAGLTYLYRRYARRRPG